MIPPILFKRIAIAYPSGNTTAIVFGNFPKIDRKLLNNKIMGTWKINNPQLPEIEQCCFIWPPKNPKCICHVEMFGGEFCGNAARSAVWLLTKGKNQKGLIEVSGVSYPLVFSVHNGNVTIDMPLSTTVLYKIVEEGVIIYLDGITHLVVNRQMTISPRKLLTNLLESDKYNLTNFPSVGLSIYDFLNKKATFCVWVKEVDTIFDETACGSGTSAIGIATNRLYPNITDLSVVQPSGKIISTKVELNENRQIISSSISGMVSVLYDGEYKLE